MAYFDVSKSWIILAEEEARNVAEELAGYIGLLRKRAELVLVAQARGRASGASLPEIADAGSVSPPDSVPVIILNAAGAASERGGFTWRAGAERVEIYGDSLRGLWNGAFDFLAALGFSWPKPGIEELPAPPPDAAQYPLKSSQAHSPSEADPRKRRRFAIPPQTGAKERKALVHWAVRSKIDALVFSLGEKSFWAKARRGFSGKHDACGLGRYALILEAGGGDLSLLLPRSLFFFHRDLFRMESGKRTIKRYFCPTNPQTTSRVMARSRELFSRAAAGMSANAAKVFHLLPDAGFENDWCACPACRAFSPAEQYRIAVNTAADALAALDAKALLGFWEAPGENGSAEETGGGIALRGNMFTTKL